jgi:hypothetical protein
MPCVGWGYGDDGDLRDKRGVDGTSADEQSERTLAIESLPPGGTRFLPATNLCR